MLAAGAAEGGQRVLGDVVAALYRDLLDRVRHVGHGDLQEPGGDLLGVSLVPGRGGDVSGEPSEPGPRRVRVQRARAGRAEHVREIRGLHAAEQHVGVGDGGRPAVAVTGWPGPRARRVRAHLVAAALEVQDGPAAGRDRMDGQHRGAHPDAGDLRLVLPLQLPREVGHVGGRAAHVEADDPGKAGRPRRLGHADDAAGRAGQDRVLAAEARRAGKATVGLHEQQPDAAQLGGDLIHVALEDGRQVGVHHGRVAPCHQPHQRADLVGRAHLREPRLARDRGDPLLVLRVPVPVHADDGGRAEAVIERGSEGSCQTGHVKRGNDLACCAYPLFRLNDPVIEQLGQDDMPVEDARPGLVGDAERVPEALGDDQDGRLAGALEQGVGGYRGAHPHGLNLAGGERLARHHAEQVPDAGDRGVPVGIRVAGQQLVRRQRAVRLTRDDVGKRPAPVNPELPASHPASLSGALEEELVVGGGDVGGGDGGEVLGGGALA